MSSHVNTVDFFIQEHWLLPDHLGALNISDDFISVSVTGMDNSELLAGRPYGGCAIMFHKCYSHSIASCSKRFCALSLIHLMTANSISC